jgi:hypothetical protein
MRGSNSGPGEVEAAEHGVSAVDPGEPTSVPDDVDYPGVAAAGEDDEPFADHVDDHGLVVEDQRVGLPPGPARCAWWNGKPVSKSLVRSTSLVISTQPPNRKEGRWSSITSKPLSASARRLVEGMSMGAGLGMAMRRLAQNSE